MEVFTSKMQISYVVFVKMTLKLKNYYNTCEIIHENNNAKNLGF